MIGSLLTSTGSGSGLLHAFLSFSAAHYCRSHCWSDCWRAAAQKHIVAQIEGLVGPVESRAVAGTIPGLFRVVPANNALVGAPHSEVWEAPAKIPLRQSLDESSDLGIDFGRGATPWEKT